MSGKTVKVNLTFASTSCVQSTFSEQFRLQFCSARIRKNSIFFLIEIRLVTPTQCLLLCSILLKSILKFYLSIYKCIKIKKMSYIRYKTCPFNAIIIDSYYVYNIYIGWYKDSNWNTENYLNTIITRGKLCGRVVDNELMQRCYCLHTLH